MDWIEIANRIGMPATLGLAFIAMFGRVLYTFGARLLTEVLIPMRQRQAQFFTAIEMTTKVQEKTLREIQVTMEAIRLNTANCHEHWMAHSENGRMGPRPEAAKARAEAEVGT